MADAPASPHAPIVALSSPAPNPADAVARLIEGHGDLTFVL
jgi:hypothetical protein